MKKIDTFLDKFETWSFVILLSMMTIVVFLQVIFRYVIESSLPWSEEFSRDCLIFCTFIGVSAGLRAGTHTSIDFLLLILPEKLKNVVGFIGSVFTLTLSIWFFAISASLAFRIFNSGQMTQGLGIPTWISYAAIPLGFFGGAIRGIQALVEYIRTKGGKLPPTESEACEKGGNAA